MPLPDPRNPTAARKNAIDGQLYVDNALIKFHVRCYRSAIPPFDVSRRIHRSTNTSSVGCTDLHRVLVAPSCGFVLWLVLGSIKDFASVGDVTRHSLSRHLRGRARPALARGVTSTNPQNRSSRLGCQGSGSCSTASWCGASWSPYSFQVTSPCRSNCSAAARAPASAAADT
jgi:hypothetical protein